MVRGGDAEQGSECGVPGAPELVPALFNAYQELRESTIHVPSLRLAVEQAKEKGVAWDPQLFCILDNVAQNYPSTWTAQR
jgi:hypothetical protein